MPASLSPWPSADKEPEEVETSPNGRYIRYNILLGKGACKRVYKALDTKEGREVAWNQVELLGMDRDEEARQHLQEEIRVLQKLKHKNIMTFYAWWYDKNNLHINFVTELFTAGNLRQYRKKLKIMSENVLKRWAHQILEGLLYLHGHTPPIVHRDLKCDNIFVNSATGEVKIGDLGLATVQQTAMSVVGTPEFMAPEVYDESYDERCDIYSFGMCLLELATLEYPYSECHSVPQIFKKVTLGIPPASLARVSSPELRDFIALCIAHNPADRPCARELLKHPYLEAVRLNTSESHGSLHTVGSSHMLAPMSNGGNSGAGTGWNTPSGTIQGAASVRDLREALHQQETLARHLMQQSQHLHPQAAQQSATEIHSGDGSSAGPHPHSNDAHSATAPVIRSLTGPMIVPPLLAMPPVLTRMASVPSPLGRIGTAPRNTSSAAEEPAAAAPGTVAASLAQPASPRLSPPSPMAQMRSGGASPVSTDEGGSRHGLLDSDSDEEVLVPIDVLKANLLAEGFVDPEGAMFSDPSEAGSDPSALSLVDPHLIANGLLAPPNSVDMLYGGHGQQLQGGHPGSLYGHMAPQFQKPRARKQTPKSRRKLSCEPIREGEGDDDDAAEAGARAEGLQEAECAEEEEEGSEQEEEEEEEELSGSVLATPSIDLDLHAQQRTSAQLRELLAARTVAAAAAADKEANREAPGDTSGTDMLPITVAAAGPAGTLPAEEPAGDAPPASPDVPISLACSVCSSASSTAKMFSRVSGGSSAGGASTGRHSRRGSSEGVTFKVASALEPSSGTCTPALRMSYNGVPSRAGEGGQSAFLSPPHNLLLRCSTMAASGDDAAVVAGFPLPPLPRSAPPHQHPNTVHSTPGGSVVGGGAVVRLPSFRNKVLLTLTQQLHNNEGRPGSPAEGESHFRFLRTTSAKTIGGGRLNEPVGFISPAGAGALRQRTWGGSPMHRGAPGVVSASAGAAGTDGSGSFSQALDAVPEAGPLAGGSSGNLPDLPTTPAGSSQPANDEGSQNTPEGTKGARQGGAAPANEVAGSGEACAASGQAESAQQAPSGATGLRKAMLACSSAPAPATSVPLSQQMIKDSRFSEGAVPPGALHKTSMASTTSTGDDLTVLREYARPIQGVIMRLKQFKRMVKDRARALRS